MFETYYTAAILLIMSIALAKEYYSPPIILFGSLLLLIVGNVITIDEAFVGFSNKGMLTVGLLFVISAALQSSQVFERTIHQLLGKQNISMRGRYIRLLFPVAILSAFLNNTPIVGTLIPIIKNWSKKNNISSSKFLIPLSYAAILGGMVTLIGTSTNLIVHGLLIEYGMKGLGFFEITKIGLPVAIIMIGFLIIFGYKLLPERKEILEKLGEHTREFVSEMKVLANYENIGKSIEEAGLRHLSGLFLFQISRGKEVINTVSPDEIILENDYLFFTGITETIYELQKNPGLQIVQDPEFDITNIDSNIVSTFEAVVSSNSPLIGHSVRESKFRDRYDGIILAIHRAGERIDKKVGDIIIKPSDTLFILAKKGFYKKWYHSMDFHLVSSSLEIFAKPAWKSNLSIVLLLGMVLVAACNLVPIIVAAGFTALLMILTKIISFDESKKSINWNVLIVIATSFGIAKGLSNSGLASMIANFLITATNIFGDIGIIMGLFFVTSTLTWIITNSAVAAIMFPITHEIAQSTGIDTRALILVLVIAASTCFATPIGYQTNMMVYGPGGYKFRDFLKIGIPMNILVGVIVTFLVYLGLGR